MEVKKDVSNYSEITKKSFPINESVQSWYNYHYCDICGSKCFIENVYNSIKVLCPRCGRYLFDVSIPNYDCLLKENSGCIASSCFNSLSKINNNKYYNNDRKVQVFYDTDKESKGYKAYDETMYQKIHIADSIYKNKELENIDFRLTKIVENIAYCLETETGEFFVGETVDKLTSTVFFLKYEFGCADKKQLDIYIRYLLDKNYLSLIREEVDGKYYTLTMIGWQIARGFMKDSEQSNTIINVHRDYNDLRDSEVFSSNIGGENNAVNTCEKTRKSFWIDVWQGVVSSIFTKIIVGIMVLMLIILGIVNWDNIVEMIIGA